jgi:hypothetical protein
MPTVSISPEMFLQFFDPNGNPLANGRLFTYAAGTTTKQATYTDSTGSTPLPNPVPLDAMGACSVWLDVTKTYKFTLAPPGVDDPPTNPIKTIDNIPASIPNSDVARLSLNNTFTGISQTVSGAEANWKAVDGPVTLRMLASAFNGAAYFGTTSNHALNLQINNATIATISTAGNYDFKAGTVTTSNTSALEVGYKGIPQDLQTVDYTAVLADAGKHIMITFTGSKTATIPANGSVAFPIGTSLTFVSNCTTGMSIAITTDTLYLAGTGFATTGTRTLAYGGIANALKISATQWLISGTGLT